MLRRILAPLLAGVSVIAAYLCWDSLTVSSAAPRDGELAAAVVSPRRVPSLLAEVDADARLRGSLQALLASRPAGANSCLTVRRGGRVVVNQNADAALTPASTLKILTAQAALATLGADSRFQTVVRRNREVQNGVLSGPLYVVGGGDPLLMTPAYVTSLPQRRTPREYTSVDDLAQRVADAGIKRVAGGLVVDDDRFDDRRDIPTWEAGYRQQGQVGAIGALVVNDGLGPPPVGRTPATDPGIEAAAALREALERRGVAVDGGVLRGNTPQGAETVASIDSPPMTAIVAHMLSASDNTAAEVLVKNIAVAEQRAGTTAAGVAELREALREVGLDTQRLTAVDGSGLDRGNKATCRLIEAALRSDGTDGAVVAGLPLAGQTGTLDDRMVGSPAVGRVRAKTGSLLGTSALAGWSLNPDGPLSFATISNSVDTDAARAYEDRLAALLATAPAPGDGEAFAPGTAVTR